MDRRKSVDCGHDQSTEKLQQELEKISKELQHLHEMRDLLSKDSEMSQTQTRTKKQHINAQHELIEMIADQIKLNESLRKECPQSEWATLDQNKEELERLLQGLRDTLVKWETQLKQLNSRSKQLERESISLVPAIMNMKRQVVSIEKALISRGVNLDDNKKPTPTVPTFEECTWLMMEVTRDAANKMLAGKPDGSFLIRKGSDTPFALSIMMDNVVRHCRIYQDQNGHVGFSSGQTSYIDLKNLVSHYQSNSLEPHNSVLKTCLKYPLKTLLDQYQNQVEYSQLLPTPP